jgi:hypothetical protein
MNGKQRPSLQSRARRLQFRDPPAAERWLEAQAVPREVGDSRRAGAPANNDHSFGNF